MTVGYSGTPLWKKLGYKEGFKVYIKNPPEGYEQYLTGLPEHRFDSLFYNRKAHIGKMPSKLFKTNKTTWHDLGIMAKEIIEGANGYH
jgi:hypothetical protein